ncbi:hypothetical protein [Paracoccus sp. (in: a-proteobacteria)]|uniref:hypothetical protein n=1 Tax=Paracoccus sp. TaxID=267 RepID=UPI003A88B364
MTNSIALGADGELNHTLAVLRQATPAGRLASRTKIMPGISWHADPALELEGNYSSPGGRLLEIETRPRAEGAWNALHLSLPARDLRGCGVLGFALRSATPDMLVLRACLRSGLQSGSGFEDCFFTKHVLVRPEESVHLDALPAHHQPRLPLEAPWRELVLFFPVTAFRFSLIDLRVFLV